MTLTDRDRKIVLVLVPVVVLAAFWLLLLAPKREEAAAAGDRLAEQEQTLDATRGQLAQLQAAKTSFADDYAEMVKLGKAIPSAVDMPSLLVQLDTAARGTSIDFTSISVGERVAAAAPPPDDGTAPPAAAGGTPASSGPGQAAETASETVADADDSAVASEAAAEGVDTSTSTSTGGGLPVGGGSAAAAASVGGGCNATGLECVSLEMEFTGAFFDLADLFHRLKRLVETRREQLLVRGRLLTIDGLSFSSENGVRDLKATVTATVYLSPVVEGVTAGATPSGPVPVSSDAPVTGAATPTAAVTP